MADTNGNGDLDLLWELSSETTIGIAQDYDRSFQKHVISYTTPSTASKPSGYDYGFDYVFKNKATKSYTYDSVFNQLTSVTDELGHQTLYTLDATTGNVLKTTHIIGQLDSATNNETNDVVTSYTYTSSGQLDTIVDALQHITDYDYDTRGNNIKTTTAKGTLDEAIEISEYDLAGNRTASIDALGHRTTYIYDAVGNRTKVTDALNHATTYVYDSLNRQIRVIDANNQTTTTGYDKVGNVLTITDADLNTTTYTYDALNRRKTDTNSLGKTRTYGYDAVGDLTTSIDRNGRKRTYDYDALYRETAEHWLDSNNTDIRTTTYSYDKVGHLLTTNDPDSKYTYTYDLVDRITSVDNLGTTGVPNVLLDYSYDAAGNLLSVTDKINGIQKGTNAYTYDILNRVIKLTQSGTGVTSKRVDMTYNRVNQIATLNRYSDLTGTSSVANTSYTYDLAGRLQTLTHQHGATTLASYGLTYDNANRIIQSSGTDGTQDYSYDSTNQLTVATHTTQTDEAYSYDANGNRTNSGSSTGTNNQLLTDGTYNYEYDGEGNRTKRTEIGTGKVTEYVWDYRNRLTSVLFKDASGAVTKTIQYTYDVNDRRIGKQIDGVVTERYVYDGSNIALVFDVTGTQTHRYLYGVGVDQVLADERGGTVVWALSDNQGTVRDIVDGNGTILNHIVYDSFGQVVSQSDATVEFRYGYTGREQDGETGLDYYRARYYDAANGRFISEDPIGFSAGDSNLTRYVGNNAVNWVDPSGLTPIPVSTLSPSKGRVESYPSRISEPVNNSTLYPSLNRGRLQTGPGYVESFPARQGTPGEFSPNYGAKNKPKTSFSSIQIRTSGSKFEFPPNTTFPGTGTCSIGGKLPANTGHTHKYNPFTHYFGSNYEVPESPVGGLKGVSDDWLKEQGVDPHTVKDFLPGKSKEFDIYKDKDGNLWGLRKPKYVPNATPEYLGNIEEFKQE
jgi:RHS repeat-associated protein